MTTTWLTTREHVRAVLGDAPSPRINRLIDGAIATGSGKVLSLCHLATIRPVTATRYFPHPDPVARSVWWRLWLDEHTLISATAITAGGVAVTDYNLEPVNSGPPYTSVEVNLGGTSTFTTGATFQRGISIAGLWGHSNTERAAGALAAAVPDTTGTTITVTDAAEVGVGDLIRIDSERMQITDRSWATTGTTITADLAALDSARTISVADGTAIHPGELLLIGSERLEVIDIVANTVTAIRAVDGSVLAAHTNGTTVQASRALTVQRAAAGTTAATHSTAATVYAHVVPAEAEQLATAETLALLGLTAAAQQYGDIVDLRAGCRRALGRMGRTL